MQYDFDWLLLNKLGLTEFIGTLQEGICMAGYFNKLGGEYLLKQIPFFSSKQKSSSHSIHLFSFSEAIHPSI